MASSKNEKRKLEREKKSVFNQAHQNKEREKFKQSVDTASHYVHFVVQTLENKGMIQSPFDSTSAKKVVEIILKKIYIWKKTATELVNEMTSAFRDIDTREQLVATIVMCRSIVDIINKDMEDSVESMA